MTIPKLNKITYSCYQSYVLLHRQHAFSSFFQMEANKTLLDPNLPKIEIISPKSDVIVKPYKRRWLILVIFALYAAINGAQWVEYAIITDIAAKYYNVSTVAVDWTSIIFMAVYAPFTIPASYIIDEQGLRTAGLIGCVGTAIGSFIKIFSVGPNLFWLVMVGQFILGAVQVLIYALPPRLAAVWFQAKEVSTACSLGIFGFQLGCAFGFVVTPIIVKDHENLDDIGENLKVMSYIFAASMAPLTLAVIFYFPRHPPNPPSVSQAEERRRRDKFSVMSLLKSMKALVFKRSFMIHNVAYSMNVGVFCALNAFVNQVILPYFPNSHEDVGMMGLTMIIMGILGCLCIGLFLDKTHKFKATLSVVYTLSFVSLVALMFALEMKSKIWTYICIGLLGFFLTGYMPAALDMGIELTYPASEGTISLLLIGPSQIMGVIFGIIMGKLITEFGPVWALGSQAVILGLGTLITFFVPNKLRRQEAFARHKMIELGNLNS